MPVIRTVNKRLSRPHHVTDYFCMETGSKKVYDHHTDREALRSLFLATSGRTWTTKHGWEEDSNDLESWHGVSLNTSGRVNVVNLFKNNLKGAQDVCLVMLYLLKMSAVWMLPPTLCSKLNIPDYGSLALEFRLGENAGLL